MMEGEAPFMGGPPPEGPPPEGPPHHGGREFSPLDHWMRRLQTRDPEEFERLRTLHEENPEAFMRELRERIERLQQKHILSELKAYPELYNAITNMPEDERREVLQKITHHPGQGPRGPEDMNNRGQPMGHSSRGDKNQYGAMSRKGKNSNPEIRALSRETREMANAYQQAETQEEKEAIHDDLRAKLDDLFELREAERKTQIQRVQKEVEKLQKILDRRRKNKESIIEKRLQELTADETTRW